MLPVVVVIVARHWQLGHLGSFSARLTLLKNEERGTTDASTAVA
jgi:hypothetical protein